MAERSRHQAIDPSRQGSRHVLGTFSRSNADLFRFQQDGVPAELSDPGLEAHVGSQRWLLEIHRERAAFERARAFPRLVVAPQLERALDHRPEFIRAPIRDAYEILWHLMFLG